MDRKKYGKERDDCFCMKMKKNLEGILAHHSGKTSAEISKASDRDNFMSPQEAKDFGLIDEIVMRAEGAPTS